MEKLYRAQFSRPNLKEPEIAVRNPIERDNRAFDIENGSKKTLDYLDNASTIIKGALAASGSIKLCPKCGYDFKRDYGAYSPYERKNEAIEIKDKAQCDEIENSWDNIFLNRNNCDNFFENDKCAQYE